MDIDSICKLLLDALEEVGYKNSTIRNYRRLTERFKRFCKEHDSPNYTREIGKLYTDDVISPKTGKFSPERRMLQGRFIRLINSYIDTGRFDFSVMKRGRLKPHDDYYLEIYNKYCSYLDEVYENINTRHYYDYGMYSFLSFLESRAQKISIEEIKASDMFDYLKSLKKTRQREALCELKNICRYLERNDLLAALAGIHAPRYNRIIPMLDPDEQDNLKKVTQDEATSLRDAAMIILGLSTGIRACDIINLRLNDIDWDNETISWKQSKTGNVVCIPLTRSIGNVLARYITEQRPDAPNDYLFVRMIAPFDRLSCHSSCYMIVKRIFKKAGIENDCRISGMHMLRHNAASTMVRNSVPIETIAAILGHSDPDTTGIYITTDDEKLRECVLPFNGISREVNQ